MYIYAYIDRDTYLHTDIYRQIPAFVYMSLRVVFASKNYQKWFLGPKMEQTTTCDFLYTSRFYFNFDLFWLHFGSQSRQGGVFGGQSLICVFVFVFVCVFECLCLCLYVCVISDTLLAGVQESKRF